MTPALLFALTLAASAPAPDDGGEPLPASAPTDSYQLAAWCYGALDEYLIVYEKVIPDLKTIDRMFGTSVVEAKPYSADMAAARVELKLIGGAVTDAEKASPQPIAEQGAGAVNAGRAIWSVAEGKTRRELARAWLGWALPDRCDSNARELAQRSLLLGKALTYNADSAAPAPPAADAAAQPAAAAAQPPVDAAAIPAADATASPPAPTSPPSIDSLLAPPPADAPASGDAAKPPAPTSDGDASAPPPAAAPQ